mmetsp:Transcript_26657/g.55537  ORF Transcript_26657/g.55537 Transcript_26657/m.55537 type:complete len:153 (+) Transcript_26657:3-461(+)
MPPIVHHGVGHPQRQIQPHRLQQLGLLPPPHVPEQVGIPGQKRVLRADQPENGAAGPHGRVGRSNGAEDVAGHPGDEVRGQEACRSEGAFDVDSNVSEGVGIGEEVSDAPVEEEGGDEAVELPSLQEEVGALGSPGGEGGEGGLEAEDEDVG